MAAFSPERAPKSWFFSGHARRSYLDADFELGDALVFGKESVGLPRELLEERGAQVIGIPMPGHVRSHNLANSVSIAVYEALAPKAGARRCSDAALRSVNADRGLGLTKIRVHAATHAARIMTCAVSGAPKVSFRNTTWYLPTGTFSPTIGD